MKKNHGLQTPRKHSKSVSKRSRGVADLVKLAAKPSVARAAALIAKRAAKHLKKSKVSNNVGVKEVEGHVGGTVTKSSYHEFPHKTHNPKIMAKMIAPETYYFNDKFNLTCGSGAQSFTSLMGQLNFSGLEALFVDLNEIKSYEANGSNTLTAAQSCWKIFIEDIEVVYYMTSYAPVAMEMDFYDLDLKRYTNQTPEAFISSGITDRDRLSHTLSTNPPTRQYFGMEPMESEVFKKFYTIKKCAHVTIPAGGTHKHTSHIAINRWVSHSQYGALPSVGAGCVFPKLTQVQMIGLRGYPVKYHNTSTVTTDAVQLAVVGSYKIRWRAAPFETSVIDITLNNNLDTGGGNIDIVEQAANIVVDVVESL